MTEDNKDKLGIRLNEAFDRLENEPPTESSNQKPTKSAPIGNVLSVLLALIAIGLGAYGAFKSYEQGIESERFVLASLQDKEKLQQLSNRIEALSRQEDTTGHDSFVLATQKIEDYSVDHSRAMAALQAEIDKKYASLKESLGTSSEDWLLAEAEYLIRLANQRVKMEADITGALALLLSADDIVKNAEGVLGFDLRAALTNNIASLRRVEQVDVDGVYLNLAELINGIADLKQKQREMEARPITSDAAEVSGFLAITLYTIKKMGMRLASLVDFQSDVDRIQIILPPKARYYLEQNLELKFQLAQLALLRGNQAVFSQSLETSSAWIKKYFSVEQKHTEVMLATIEQLGQVKIKVQQPDISSSLREIRNLMADFRTQALRQASPEKVTRLNNQESGL